MTGICLGLFDNCVEKRLCLKKVFSFSRKYHVHYYTMYQDVFEIPMHIICIKLPKFWTFSCSFVFFDFIWLWGVILHNFFITVTYNVIQCTCTEPRRLISKCSAGILNRAFKTAMYYIKLYWREYVKSNTLRSLKSPLNNICFGLSLFSM